MLAYATALFPQPQCCQPAGQKEDVIVTPPEKCRNGLGPRREQGGFGPVVSELTYNTVMSWQRLRVFGWSDHCTRKRPKLDVTVKRGHTDREMRGYGNADMENITGKVILKLYNIQ